MHRLQLISSQQIMDHLYRIIANNEIKPEELETLVAAYIEFIKDLNQEVPESKLTSIYAKFCAKTNGKYSVPHEPFFIDMNCVIEGSTCLILAARKGYFTIVKILVEARANPTFELPFNSPLDSAVQSGNNDTVKYLLEKKASVEFFPKHISPVTHRAVDRSQATILKTLVDHNASFDLIDHFDKTALMWAIQVGREECVDVLLKENVNLELKNSAGKNAIDFLKEYKPLSIIHQFLKVGKIQQGVVWIIFQDMDCSHPEYLYWLNLFCTAREEEPLSPYLPPEATQFLNELIAFKHIVDAHFPKEYLAAIKTIADDFFPNCEKLVHDYCYYPLEDVGMFKPAQLSAKNRAFLAAHPPPPPVVKKKTPGSR